MSDKYENPLGGNILASMFATTGKPRSPGEWQIRFTSWRRKPSDTEGDKIRIAERRVLRALENSIDLKNRSYRIIRQGSYYNRTNVRIDSDVDLCVQLHNAVILDSDKIYPTPSLSEAKLSPLPFKFSDFRHEVEMTITKSLGRTAVDVTGNKAIQIYKDDQVHVSVDVVPVYEYRYYRSSEPDIGVALITKDGKTISNFPNQHFVAGNLKNSRTNRRYKHVVRILKRLRNHIAENEDVLPNARQVARDTPSFLIESLVFNCRDELFNNIAIYDDVASILSHLHNRLTQPSGPGLMSFPERWFWKEVNGIKSLFGSHQSWTEETALAFVFFALTYMDL